MKTLGAKLRGRRADLAVVLLLPWLPHRVKADTTALKLAFYNMCLFLVPELAVMS